MLSKSKNKNIIARNNLIWYFYRIEMKRWILTLIILFFLAEGGCIIGNREGIISGTVINSAGDIISSVNISISSANLYTTSDATGYFILSGLKVGTYEVVMKKTGYADTTTSVELPDPGALSCSTPAKTTRLTLPLASTNITGLIYNVAIPSTNSGYDFTETSETAATATTIDSRVVPSTSARCDVYFTYIVSLDKRILTAPYGIKDLGYKNSLNDVSSAPTTDYIGNAEVIPGHCYIIRTTEGYHAKLRAETVNNTTLYFFWSLQPVTTNTQFSPKSTR